MQRLRTGDLRALLALVAASRADPALSDFPAGMLRGLRQLVSADVAVYRTRDALYVEPADVPSPRGASILSAPGAELLVPDPTMRRRLSRQIVVTLGPQSPGVQITVARCERNFSRREQELIEVLRPHLITLDRDAALARLQPRQIDGPTTHMRLTQREVEVLRHVAAGATDKQIAALLGIRPKTVQKHLEHAYAKLEVGTRTAAVARLTSGLAGKPVARFPVAAAP